MKFKFSIFRFNKELSFQIIGNLGEGVDDCGVDADDLDSHS